jgi:carboxyl-terminal processing protease
MAVHARRSWRTMVCAVALLLTACGGGGGGGASDNGSVPPPLSCGVADVQDWLHNYMNAWYYWYALAPNPSPAGYATVADYFDALLYPGGDPIPNGGGKTWPLDRYSNFQSTASFSGFFVDGQTLGYGVAVAGLEVTTPAPQPLLPLYVRYVEPLSPAAAAGVVRGDRVMSINGVLAADIIRANDFSALTANAVGDTLDLVLRPAVGADRPVRLSAAVFALAPVQNGQVLLTQANRKVGYVLIKDMIGQVETRSPSLFSVMNEFKAHGIQELVLDLRYNGGGLVSVGTAVASYAAGAQGINNNLTGKLFARLLYNDKRTGNNSDFAFTNPAAWAGFSTVYVLAGPRTCSASEQVINGLLGIGVNVVAIGNTTCGKPVGFLPQDDSCGTTYSVVNFESVNRLGQGRYFDGFAPTCMVAEDFSQPTGSITDPLMMATGYHIDNGMCPVGTALREQPQARLTPSAKRYSGADGGERTGMSAR